MIIELNEDQKYIIKKEIPVYLGDVAKKNSIVVALDLPISKHLNDFCKWLRIKGHDEITGAIGYIRNTLQSNINNYKVEVEQNFDRMMNDMEKGYIFKARNAKDRGYRFSIGMTEFEELFEQRICQYTGEVFDDGDLKATMERINPFDDYTLDNVRMVTYAANQEKALLDQFVKGNVISNRKKIDILLKMVEILDKR